MVDTQQIVLKVLEKRAEPRYARIDDMILALRIRCSTSRRAAAVPDS
jgi:hypothetical protein